MIHCLGALALLILGLVALWSPPPGVTASAALPARIGLLGPAEEPRFSDLAAGLRQGFIDHGYPADAVHIVEGRTRRGDDADARVVARALARQSVAAVFVVGSALARLAREAVPQLPLVFVTPGDPVAAGLVASLARPGAT